MTKKIYLASPFFDDEQINRVKQVESALAANDTVASFFSPRLNQHEEFELFSEPWRQATYAGDIKAIESADVLVAVIDYEDNQVDPGTAWEFGYAVAKGIPVIVLKEKSGAVNLMMGVPLQAYFTNIEDIQHYNFDELKTVPFSGEIF